MSFLESLFAAITSKAAVGAAAATLAAGGVVVVATPNADEPGPDEEISPAILEQDDEVGDLKEDLEPIPVSEDQVEGDPMTADDLLDEADDEGDGGDGDDERSEVARAVHDALTDGQAVPGDPDFGRIVSENAREGGLGKKVSEAARAANGSLKDDGSDDLSVQDADDADEGQPEARGNVNRPANPGRGNGKGNGKPGRG